MSTLRTSISGAIEILIDILDRIDGDPDFEREIDEDDQDLEIDSAPFQPIRETGR